MDMDAAQWQAHRRYLFGGAEMRSLMQDLPLQEGVAPQDVPESGRSSGSSGRGR